MKTDNPSGQTTAQRGAASLAVAHGSAFDADMPWPMSKHRKRLMLRLAKKLTQQQIDCVSYALLGRKITDNGDYQWRKFDVVYWHNENNGLSPNAEGETRRPSAPHSP